MIRSRSALSEQERCVWMAQGHNQRRGMDSITLLSGGLSVMLTLPLAPKVMNATDSMTHRALVNSYGADLASWGMLIHAGASFVVTFFALVLLFQISLRLLIQQISRLTRRSHHPRW